MVLFTAKNIAIFFGLASIAFCVSTVVLAVQKADLEDDLQDALDKLEALEATTPATTSSPTPSSTDSSTESTGSSSGSTASPGSTNPGESSTNPGESSTNPGESSTNPGETSTPSSSPSSPGSSSTGSPELPTFPTLPPGLPDPEEVTTRLPTDIRPIRYQLYYHPDLEGRTFTGSVQIQIEIDKETNLIVMHCDDLEISSPTILNMMARMRIRVRYTRLDEDKQMFFIVLDELLYPGFPYVVSMDFSGKLDGLTGVYVSSYLNENNEQRWIATSKFEPTYARQAFPCFDEPSLKADFFVTIVRPTGDNYIALSNMDMESETKIDDKFTEVTFTQSVPMSTYLVCFIVADFAHKSKQISGVHEGANEIEMRVFATPAQVEKVTYALDTGVAITEFYIELFNVSYPLPKLDMAAIPDFVSGAMEHWGLVTFRETALLYDPAISSSANKQRVATVIAHELAHMWFGNLVTMKWWNDLWLNEGFASYIEYKGVHAVHPDWKMLHQFVVEDMHGVMTLDATLASHPIVQKVDTPSQITELFDKITYSKGASIIRMLENLVGEEKFNSAVTSYLWNHYFSNAETDDFLSEIEAQEFPFNVKLIMQTWTEQMGLPVVEVTKVDETTYKLTQKRFLSNSEDYNVQHEPSTFNYRWSIPITYFSDSDFDVKTKIFNYDDSEITIEVPSAVQWIKFNKNQVGYYRVNYPVDMWENLITVLTERRADLSDSDRAHLINDAFVLADAGQLDYSVALKLSAYLEKERDYVPWAVATTRLSSIRHLLYYTDIYSEYVTFARKLIMPAYESVGWEVGTDHLHNLLRVDILGAACAYGHPEAMAEAAKQFQEWLNAPDVRPKPDIRGTVYYYGMQQLGNEKIWDTVWQLFLKEEDAQEKIKLMQALAAVKEPWLLQRYINYAWDENNVRGQDYFTALQYIAMNRVGESLVWHYVRENWPRLVQRFGLNERYLGRLIPGITSRFTTQTKLSEMESFFAKYPDAGAGTAARKEALETVKYNIKWLQANKQQIGKWLTENQNSGGDNRISKTSQK